MALARPKPTPTPITMRVNGNAEGRSVGGVGTGDWTSTQVAANPPSEGTAATVDRDDIIPSGWELHPLFATANVKTTTGDLRKILRKT